MAKNILIIEDEAPLLDLLHDRLASEGYEVKTASEGKKGLEMALQGHPDLILLDIMLPGMDGVSLLKKLHNDPWGKHAEVIMLTNLSNNQSVADALALGSHYFLVKSDWKIEDVVGVVHDRLRLKK